ncbi:response regulator transcription factor [Raoultibacter phocaeensis]|uniref:response regulator transcription factor n=1 Tax=Raoultibacter phocaeensis TaxID=2479841 RepID=UPI00111856AC|nr:response regulator transcription factor [Raoultibacter phocaeensis]
MARILIVDDDADLSAITARFLESEGYETTRAGSAEEAYDLLTRHPVDLVLLDINLPTEDGFAICSEIRRASTVPLIFASARTSETDRITGFDIGGDDYLPKPYSLRELLSHVKALLRRASDFSNPTATSRTVGPFAIDEAAGILAKNGEPVALSPKEFALACRLMRAPGTAVSKEQLLGDVWGPFSDVEPQTVSVHMNWLRTKLEDDPQHPRHFVTVRGKGYRFDPCETAS